MSIRARLAAKFLRLRFAGGLRPRNPGEISAYLHHLAGRTARSTGPLKMPWGNFTCTDLHVARSQFEEIFVKRQYAFRTESPAPVIIDCGGNVGLSAIWFKQNHPGCRLTVYEADPKLAAILTGNLAQANCADVDVLNQAVWIEDGFIAFAPTGTDTGKIDPEGFERVKSTDLAAVLPDRVDLLKMDIEGAEFAVIDRLLTTGAIQRVRHLAVEFHPTRATHAAMLTLFQRMESAGFKMAFESFLGPFCGLETAPSPFDAVGRNRMFVQAYAWRY